ncbi:hypothetical protein T4E_1345 [Trichinella pseudospiralis]|uniref:Uncharacterized protein n=1 Tax=Trichinella pseudospiralis TaxID=6337 RepID=A0A0V0XM88_TRIPS|nr:hypothetical protein T4E_1345 [Trichinella pseudospiralis]
MTGLLLAIDVAICRLSTTDKSHLRCHADEPAGSGLPETKKIEFRQRSNFRLERNQSEPTD